MLYKEKILILKYFIFRKKLTNASQKQMLTKTLKIQKIGWGGGVGRKGTQL